MEIKGRECEQIKIGEHVYSFLTEFKGKEYRQTIQLVLKDSGTKDGVLDVNIASFVANLPGMFSIFCLEVDGETPKPEMLDELPIADYQEIQVKITSLAEKVFTQVK